MKENVIKKILIDREKEIYDPENTKFSHMIKFIDKDLLEETKRLDNFNMTAIHMPCMVVGTIVEESGKKYLKDTVSENGILYPCFKSMSEAKENLYDESNDSIFVLNPSPIKSLGVLEPCNKNTLIKKLKKHNTLQFNFDKEN